MAGTHRGIALNFTLEGLETPPQVPKASLGFTRSG